jgi:hypothetical protein
LFAALRNHARNHNRRLADVAAAVIAGATDASSLDAMAARTELN